jgi:hypothetical protein
MSASLSEKAGMSGDDKRDGLGYGHAAKNLLERESGGGMLGVASCQESIFTEPGAHQRRVCCMMLHR